MKRFNYFLFLAVLFLAVSCKKDKTPEEPTVYDPEQIPNAIAANTTLTADRIWILKGETHVQSGAVLTIEAGTIIKSDVSLKGALIVDKGARVEAVGTAAKPIVFTSGKPVNERAPGDWAGITIIGRAPTNRTAVGTVEGGVTGQFGLDNISNDNSGIYKYLRIEYAGVAVAQGSEVNAMSFYAVGSGTTLDHIQVSYAKDDAFEFFGGTVNGKYLISYGTSDDDFDFDFGYRGHLQFGVVLRRPELADAGDFGNGIECDNEGTIPGTGPSAPLTRPVISNFTFLGSNGAAGENVKHNFAARFRKATQFVVVNSILAGFKEGGLVIESSQTATSYNDGSSVFKNNAVTALKQTYFGDAAALGVISATAIQAKAEAEGNSTLANSAAVGLVAGFNLTAPDFHPATGSPALLGTFVNPFTLKNDANLSASFFSAVTYRGAFAANDTWANTWTNFNPGTTVY